MRQQYRLETAHTVYVVSTVEGGAVLDYWGPPSSSVEMWDEPERIVSLATADDHLPLELATQGQRHVAFSEVRVERPNGLSGAGWGSTPQSVRHGPHELTMTHAGDGLLLTTFWRTSAEHDVITRWFDITNTGTGDVWLPRALSAGWNIPIDAPIHYLSGSWAREFQTQTIELSTGTFSMDSRHGVTSATFNPVLHVGSWQDHGDAYSVALAWSGSWTVRAESSTVGLPLRVSAGLSDESVITLGPGETFTAPEALGVFSPAGLTGLADRWHAYQRVDVSRSTSPTRRPVIYNSWYATTFDVSAAGQLELARRAAQLGVDTFVVDDGWFKGRHEDTKGLGDWEPDVGKLPAGLSGLAQAVHRLGLGFGIWIEPECVNPDSDLYRAHPEWVYRAGSRPLKTIRNQYVLDLGRDDVAAWVLDTVRNLLGSAPITYLKWDMNRPVTDGGRVGDPKSRQWTLQHTRNLYRIWETVRREFPHVVLEGCAAGGSRIDNRVLSLTDVVWPSDEVGPQDRLAIQHGFLSAYPSWTMSSWVCDEVGLDTRHPVSLGYKFAVAMCGVLGVGADLTGWSPSELSRARGLIEQYRDLRPIIHGGTVRRHGHPRAPLYCVEFGGAINDDRSVAFVFDSDRDRARDRGAPRVRLSTLRPGMRYRVAETGEITDLAVASRRGVRVPFKLDVDADILTLLPLHGPNGDS